MKKRKINPEYLRHITSSDVKDDAIDSLDFALSIKSFADEYLGGIMTVEVKGISRGTVSLKLTVVSYLVRLLAEAADDSMAELSISVGDEINIEASLERLPDIDETAHIVKVARLAGFDVERYGEMLRFKTAVRTSSIMQIYATSSEDFENMLAITHEM